LLRPERRALQFFKKQRGRNHRSRDAALGRAKRSKGRAGEAGDLALHIVVNKIVVANPGKVAQGTRVQPDDARTADHFFPAGVRIHAENNQGQTIAGAGAAAEARQQFREIFLVQQAQLGLSISRTMMQ